MADAVVRRQSMTRSRVVETIVSAYPASNLPKAPSNLGTSQQASLSKRENSNLGPSVAVSKKILIDSVDEQHTGEDDPFKDVDFAERSFKQGNFRLITVFQWFFFVVLMTALICSLTIQPLEEQDILGLHLWKWFLMALVVFCGRLLSGWLIRIVVIVCEKNFLLKQKVLYFVYGLRKAVQNFVWVGLALLAWMLIFNPHVERQGTTHNVVHIITKVLQCFLIGAGLWLLKIVLVKSLASSFHVKTFFERIQESLLQQHLLEALYGPPLADVPAFMANSIHGVGEVLPFTASITTANALEGGIRNASVADGTENYCKALINSKAIQGLENLESKNVSAGLMKKLMNLVQHPGIGTLITTFDEYAAPPDSIEINSEMEAKIVAKSIFKNVAREGASYIEREDLLRFLPPNQVARALSYFDGGKDSGRISKKALKNWVVYVYQERRALAYSLSDTKTAVNELHSVASILISILIIILWLLILGITSTHVLLLVTSQVLLLGFIFSNTLKQIFEAVIFLFVMHPVDVGDRCIVDGTQLIVEEMKIMYTAFLKGDNEKVYYPNSVLATKPISNLNRSPPQRESMDFSVHISMPSEKITDLKARLEAYVQRKSDQWQPKVSVQVIALENLNRMQLGINMGHTINFQNMVERLNRRTELLLELKNFFCEHGIEYRLLTQPVQLVPSSSAYCSNNNMMDNSYQSYCNAQATTTTTNNQALQADTRSADIP